MPRTFARRFLVGAATVVAALLACGDPSGPDQPGPSIVLSAASASFQATTNGANPASTAVTINNGGGGTLSGLSASTAYTGGQAAGWLTTTLSGTTAPSTLTISATTGGILVAGTYTATVTISAAAAENAPQTISVTFTLGQAPSIALSTTNVEFAATAGGADPAGATAQITNGGGATLADLSASITYAGGQPEGWLTTSLSGTTAPSTLTLTATTGSLAAGTYGATVAIASAAAANTPESVTVTFVVDQPPFFPAGIYVSASDPTAVDDAACGLGPVGTGAGRYPCRTIGSGLARANATGQTQVLVADGVYNEAVTLVNGRSVLGGYRPDTWERHLSTTNTIIQGVSSFANHDRTVIAVGITSSTVFEGFVVRGALNAKAGGNSYAIYVSASNQNLVIRNNLIYGGRGARGRPAPPASTAAPARPGQGAPRIRPGTTRTWPREPASVTPSTTANSATAAYRSSAPTT